MKMPLRQLDLLREYRPLVTKLFSFASIGLVNAVVDISIFTLTYKVFELPLIACNVVAWVFAASGSYVMNTRVTFRSESGGILRRRDYLAFLASGVLGVVAATVTLLTVSHFASVAFAKLTSIFVSFAANFTMSRFVVFRPDLAKNDLRSPGVP